MNQSSPGWLLLVSVIANSTSSSTDKQQLYFTQSSTCHPHPLHANTGCDVIGVSLHISWNWIDELMPVCDLASAALYAACHHWSVMQIHRSKFTALSGNLKVLHQTVAGASSPIYPASHQTNKQTNKQIWSCSDDILHTPSFIYFRPAPPSWLTLKTNAAEAQRVTSRQQESGAELSWRQCTWLLSQSCVWKEAAGPLKAKMVSCKLHLLPSVSFLPFRDHRAFKIEPELTWRTEGKPDTQDTHKHTHKEDFVFLFLH